MCLSCKQECDCDCCMGDLKVYECYSCRNEID